MRIVRRILPLLFLFIIGIVFGSYLLLPGVLGRVLINVFENGTGCDVRLKNPQLRIRELKAEIEQVSIICKEDKKDKAGFFAERIEIGSSWSDLFERRVLLSPLIIEGAYAKSRNPESALFRTLNFVLAKPDKNNEKPGFLKKYFPSLVDGWHFYVPGVEVYGVKNNSSESLSIGTNDIFINFFDLIFKSEDAIDVPESIVLLSASSSRTQLGGEALSERSLGLQELGEFVLNAEADPGRIRIVNAESRLLADKNLEAKHDNQFYFSASGEIETRQQELSLDVELQITKDSLSPIFNPVFGELNSGHLSIASKIQGALGEPVVSGFLNLESLSSSDQSKFRDCVPSDVSGKFSYKSQAIFIENVAVEDFLFAELVGFDFSVKDKFSVNNKKPVDFKTASKFLSRCIGSDAVTAIYNISGGLSEIPLSISYSRNSHDSGLGSLFGVGNIVLGDINRPLFSLSSGKDDLGDIVEIKAVWPSTVSSVLKTNAELYSRIRVGNDSSDYNIETISVSSFSVSSLIELLKPIIGDLSSLIPGDIIDDPHFISLDGSVFLSSENFYPRSGEINVDLSGDSGSGLFSVSLLADKNISRMIARLPSGVQDVPVFDLELSPDKLEGTYNLKDVYHRDVPALSFIFGQGRHLFTISGNINRSGNLLNSSGVLGIESRRGKKRDPVIENSEISYKIESGKVTISGSIIEDSLRVSCSPEAGVQVSCSLKANDFPLRYFFSRKQKNLSDLVINANGRFSGELSDLIAGNGILTIEALKNSDLDSSAILDSPVEISLEAGTLKLKPLMLGSSGGKPLELSGTLSRLKGWDFSAKGILPLILFSDHLPALESVSGQLVSDISLLGDLGSPRLEGDIIFQDVGSTFLLGEKIIGAEAIEGKVVFRDHGVYLENIRGEFSEGKLDLTGSLSNFFSEKRSGSFRIKAEEVSLEPASGLVLLGSLDLNLVFDGKEQPILKGRVSFDEATFESSLNIETVLKLLSSVVLSGFTVRDKSGEPLSSSGVLTDIFIDTPSGLYLDASVLQADLTGDFRLEGDLLSPKVIGELRVRDGYFQINQTDFRVISGTAVFDEKRNSTNPRLALSSEGELKSATGETSRIYLTLGGTLKSPKVNLTSDGYASQRELSQQLGMSSGGSQFQLIDSRSASSVKTRSGYREVLNPTSELSLADRFVGLTGIDDMRLETAVSTRTGEFVPQVVAARPLPYDLRGVLSTELSGDRANAARVEYRLSSRITPFAGWRSQSVTDPSATGAANFLFGIRFEDTFKGLSLFVDRIKEE
ncbi:MAG TPA: translocation/assembly module TamB domain-containing protein [Oligoflexia bacterium]|nr:translocation/assembly module TamB domain-containing protein [Oligoflexia bacterium]HMP47341.1 translocation/assembly module TamB domain-containing protein [Oligoflexia bacterium]